MADNSEWKTSSMEGEGKGDGHQYGRKPRTPEPIPIARKLTYIVRKRWDIGLLRALSLRIMMMMMMIFNKPDADIKTPLYSLCFLPIPLRSIRCCQLLLVSQPWPVTMYR